MMAKGMRVARLETGPGEAAAAARRKRMWTGIGVLFLAGFVVGLAASLLEIEPSDEWFSGTLPPWAAMAGAVFTLVALIGGSILFYRRIDELERTDNLFAGAVAANVVLAGYPVWFLLWKGGWVPAPTHGGVFLTLFGAALIAYAARKFR